MPSFFTCLTCFPFITGLTCLPFLCALRVFLFLRAIPVFIFYVSSFFKRAFDFLVWLHIFTCLHMFPRRMRWNLSDESNDLLRFLICCHQQHNAKSPQSLSKYTVNGKTCKLDNLIYFTIFSNPKFLYLHLKTFTETYSDE